MLRARPKHYRLSDLMPGGRPELTWYNQFHQYQRVIFERAPGLPALMLPNGVRNAAGQTIIAADKVNPRNYLKEASEWFLEADAATPPRLTHATPWAEERGQDLVEILLEMLRIVHAVGHGVIYVQAEQIHVVWGTNIVPLTTPGNPIPYGWAAFWPYYLRPAEDRTGIIQDAPNRWRMLYYLNDPPDDGGPQSGGGDWQYNAGLISDNEGADLSQVPAEHLNPPPIDYWAVFGTDEGFYEEGLKAASHLASLDATIQEICTTYALPVPVISSRVGVSVGAQLMTLQGEPLYHTPQQVLQDARLEAEPLVYAQAVTMIDQLMEEYLEKNKELHGITRIPLEITENRDDQMSAVSRALLAQPAVDRIEAGHRQVAEALDGAVRLRSGQGLGEITWTRQPFDTLAERRLLATEMFKAKLWSLNEAREYMDMPAVDGGDTIASTEDPEQQEDPNANAG